MECAVMVTHKYNARCRRYYGWKNPTQPEEECDPEILRKTPPIIVRLNLCRWGTYN